MSGPLASWCAAHCPVRTPAALAVLSQLALHAYPDGHPAEPTSVGRLEFLTGFSARQARRALRCLEADGVLEVLDAGGGRGRARTWRIVLGWCRQGCALCQLLRPQAEQVAARHGRPTPPVDNGARNGDHQSAIARNADIGARNTVHQSALHLVERTGDGTLLEGVPSPHRGGGARAVAAGVAAEQARLWQMLGRRPPAPRRGMADERADADRQRAAFRRWCARIGDPVPAPPRPRARPGWVPPPALRACWPTGRPVALLAQAVSWRWPGGRAPPHGGCPARTTTWRFA